MGSFSWSELPGFVSVHAALFCVLGLFFSPLKYMLLDIDGVVWSGSRVIDKVPQTLQYLRSQGKEIRFLSNNASLSREQLQQSFAKKGIDGVQAKECYNSAYAAALRIQQLLGTSEAPGEAPLVHGNIFVIGEQGLHDELQRVEVMGSTWRTPCLPAPLKRLVVCDGSTCRVHQAGTDNDEKISLSDLDAKAVVIGLDFHFNGLKLAYGSFILQGPPSALRGTAYRKPLFIATNEDPQIPIGSDSCLMPGAGSMVGALCIAAGCRPDVVCGKPSVDMAKILFETEHIGNPKESCIMIGDRLTTDVAFGNGAGCETMLVLSGIEGLADVAKAEAEANTLMVPHYTADSLACFLPQ